MPVSAPIRLPKAEQPAPPNIPLPYQLPLPFPPRGQVQPLHASRQLH